MPVDDLLEHATSGTDFYALIGQDIHAGSSDKDISRAYRRTALKHHPDKNKDDPNAVAKFHALQVAYDVLSDPAARAAYDAAREARERKRAQAERLDGRRRAFADELLRAERDGTKRKREDDNSEENALEREIKRLAEDGRRRRQERADALRREADEARREEEKVEAQGQKIEVTNSTTTIPDISRTVKIRFQRDQVDDEFSDASIKALFSEFGEVESVFTLKDKKLRPSGSQHKTLMGQAGVVFTSIIGAYSAITECDKRTSAMWKAVDSVEWAEGKEPEYVQSIAKRPAKSTLPTSARTSTVAGPSLEESTFLRLKQAQQRKAERKKLEEIMRQQEAGLALEEEPARAVEALTGKG